MARSTAPASNNGVYTYGNGNLFPTSTFNATNYWVDVVFSPTGGGTNQPPVAANDTGFNVTQNTPLGNRGVGAARQRHRSGRRCLDDHGSKRRRQRHRKLQCPEQHRDFHARRRLYGTGVLQLCHLRRPGRDGQRVRLSDRQRVVCEHVSLFSSNPTPSIVSVNDPNSVELGFKFQASSAGDITGLRFYKGASNTGTHVADLWSSTGTLLATATFTNETASGWQQVNFATPVTISAGTTYVASYHTAGNYSADPDLFATQSPTDR